MKLIPTKPRAGDQKKDGEAPVVRFLWRKEADMWRITVYDVELP